jgi:hypothetical protein
MESSLLAAESARQPVLRRHARTITRAVLIAGSVIAAVSLIFFRDQWGLLWWIAAAILVMRSRNQLMLSTCFVYTILRMNRNRPRHLKGRAPEHVLGPASLMNLERVGILYILLDLTTVAIFSTTAPC